MRILFDVAYLLAGVLISPMVLYRMARHKRYRAGWSDRFGKISRKNPEKKCIWIHAVSVGEVNAAKTIVRELENRFKEFEIVISTTTDTGFARANAVFGDKHAVFYFPLDISWIVKRAFKRIKPAICLLMELEVWPNFVMTAQASNIPVVVVNGRITDRSISKYRKILPIAKKVFRNVTIVLAQTKEYAERFRQIGAERIVITGSLKYDTAQIADRVEGADILAQSLNIVNERLWVAGGTGNDEEKIIIDVYKKLKKQEQFNDLWLVIVPRKPERFEEVAQLIKQEGLQLLRYSQIKKEPQPAHIDRQAVIIGDTMGDLRKFYSLATIIFVGRSLVPMGGSDMMEAAALGKCTMFGPYTFNFNQAVDALIKGNGAVQVQDKQQLLDQMQKCLQYPEFAQKIALNGRQVIKNNQGATIKTIEQIENFILNK